MADWQYTLELKDIRNKFDQDNDMKAMCAAHAERIQSLVKRLRFSRMEIVKTDMADELEYDILPLFEEIAEFDGDVEEYDYALEQLYNWADTSLDNKFGGKKMCWVNTF